MIESLCQMSFVSHTLFKHIWRTNHCLLGDMQYLQYISFCMRLCLLSSWVITYKLCKYPQFGSPQVLISLPALTPASTRSLALAHRLTSLVQCSFVFAALWPAIVHVVIMSFQIEPELDKSFITINFCMKIYIKIVWILKF